MTDINERRLDALELATAGLDADELAVLNGVTAGTATASKAVVLGASKEIATITSATITTLTSTTVNATNVDAGASGTAGSFDVFPTTAAKGKIALVAADSAGDTTTTITNASHGQATVVTIPDSGLSTSYLAQSTAALTAVEVDVLDGAVAGNTVASKAALLDSAKALQTNANVGTAGTGVTAVEYGDGYNHVTVLTLTAAALTPTIPADAEGAGAIIYTYPAGVYVVDACHMDITAMTVDSATNAADIGVGSLISSGDIATLTTAAMEDYVTGQTIADVSSPAKEKSTIPTGGASLLFEAGGSHVAHINIAATWNSTVATLDATGTVTIAWRFLGA